MPQSKRGRPKRVNTVPNFSQRPAVPSSSATPALPQQYPFTPPAAPRQTQSPQGQFFGQTSISAPQMRNYPPPQHLFQSPTPHREEVATPSSQESTEKDSRGNPYGVGSLSTTLLNGKRKKLGDAASFVSVQEQLKEAHRKIEEQAAYAERLEAEQARAAAKQARAAAKQQKKIDHLSIVDKYLRKTDPHYLDFVASQSHAAEGSASPSSSPSPSS